MQKLIITGIISFLSIIPLFATNTTAVNKAVKIYEIEEEILEHNQLPLDPYPPFGLLTGYITYPFQFYGSKYFQIDKKKIKILVAENEYLKIGMAPDYGGRLWFLYDKIRQKEVIHRNFKETKFYNAGMGYQYLGGGMELNIPNAHSQTNARKRECIMKENLDGSVSLIMSNTEKIGRLHWSVTFTLFPDEARIRQDVRVANETHLEERYLYWANCGIPVNENTEFIYPENSGALHGEYENEVSWPIFANKDISILKNVDEAVGFYMLNAREGYMGYYNHDEDFGLVHYADVNDLPGKKYWSWGWHVTALEKRFTHAEDVNYGEIQSGRIVIQEKFDKIAPMTAVEFTHYWYPVGAIGSFNGASENAAINFTIDKKAGATAVAEIKIQANQNYETPRLLFKNNDRILKEIALPSLTPQLPVSFSEEFEIADIEIEDVSLVLVDINGEQISDVLSSSEKPARYDSYFNAHKHIEKERKDFTAEGLFTKAELLFNDWFYHLPEIKDILGEVLLVDPGFSRAHTELGLIHLRGGKLDKALEHFNLSLNRIPNDGRTLYYKGLTLMYMGNPREAKYFLRNSGRFGYEYPERIAEAEMAIVQNDLNEAAIQLDKANSLNGNILKGQIYKALVETRLGNNREAEKWLARASSLDPENPFVSCTEYLIKKSDKSLAESIAERYEDFPEEILEVVITLYSAGFMEEAFQTLKLIRKTNSIVELYRTELEVLIGKKAGKIKDPSITAEFAWRLEEYFILKRRISQDPGDAESYYHLGNFMYAHDFEMDGIAHWEKAHELGYNDKVMLISIYRANKKLGKEQEAYGYLLDAYKLEKYDPYIFEYYVDEINRREGADEATALMEERYADFNNVYSLKARLMNAYMNNGQYDKLEKLLMRSDLHDTHLLSFGEFWKNLKMAKGYNLLKEEQYAEALEIFTKSADVPSNISQHYLALFSSQARRLFYMGYCNAKLGNQDKAEELWKEALRLKRDSKYQAGYKFRDLRTIYYQAFCLKGLGRFDESLRYITLLEDYANSVSLKNNPGAQKMLLTLSVTGLEDLDDFEKWDSALGLSKVKLNFNAPEE
jgi:tetratricopeptide (TPR) repeat protein